MNKQWAKRFKDMFEERNPDHPIVEAGLVEKFEAALGPVPLAGFFTNGEIFRNRLYSYTGVLTLFL